MDTLNLDLNRTLIVSHLRAVLSSGLGRFGSVRRLDSYLSRRLRANLDIKLLVCSIYVNSLSEKDLSKSINDLGFTRENEHTARIRREAIKYFTNIDNENLEKEFRLFLKLFYFQRSRLDYLEDIMSSLADIRDGKAISELAKIDI